MLGSSLNSFQSMYANIYFRSLAGFTIQVDSAKLTPLTVDGGFPITAAVSDSVGILYPGERLDCLLIWDSSSPPTSSWLHISLDPEYVLSQPRFGNRN
jgi:hypothetical protein